MTQPSAGAPRPSLVADIGGTNARFALVDDGGAIRDVRILAGADYPSIEAAAQAYLAKVGARPWRAAVCIAGPVNRERVSLTNLPWSFTRAGVCAALGLERLEVVNDFTAVALSVPRLGEADRTQVGDGAPTPNGVIGVIGPGSGLGVSGVIQAGGKWTALSGEGGHVTMPAMNDREAAVLARLRRVYDGHVSAERLLSGPGLVNLHQSLAELDGHAPAALGAAEITAAAIGGADPVCDEAVEMFCAMLGTVAGDLAVTLGSSGGVYIAGGIVPKLGDRFLRSSFRRRFLDKGRMAAFLAPIPTYVVTHPLPAFLGLIAALETVTD